MTTTKKFDFHRRLLDAASQVAAANDALLALASDMLDVDESLAKFYEHPSAALAPQDPSITFEHFWRAKPPREGVDPKAPARELWLRLKPTAAQAEQITAAIIAQHTGVEPAFRPHTRTWLRQKRWQDSVSQPALGAVGKAELQPNQLSRKSNEVLRGLGANVEDREFTT